MTSPEQKATIRQGWIQTSVILLGLLSTIVLFYSKLDAKADVALDKASRAELKAEAVEKDVGAAKEELVRIRTILDERLPKK